MRYPNVYGIDMPAAHELIAHGHDEDEVARIIGADRMIYQDLDDLIAAVGKGNTRITRFDTSCFDGEYVTGDVTRAYLDALAANRNDDSKSQRRGAGNGVRGL